MFYLLYPCAKPNFALKEITEFSFNFGVNREEIKLSSPILQTYIKLQVKLLKKYQQFSMAIITLTTDFGEKITLQEQLKEQFTPR